MKFGAEENGMNSGTLEITGKGMKFAPSIRQMPVAESGDNNATAFNANFETVQQGGGVAQAVVSLVQAVEDARVGGFVETMGSEKKIEAAKDLRDLEQTRIFIVSAVARCRRRRSGRRGRLAYTRLGRRFFVAKGCGVRGQERIPSPM